MTTKTLIGLLGQTIYGTEVLDLSLDLGQRFPSP